MSADAHNRSTPLDEDDPVEKMLRKAGCLEKHYAVQECMFDHKDWRKCQDKVYDFKKCIEASKSKQS